MGIREFVLDRAKKEGIVEGKAEGKAEGIAEGKVEGISKKNIDFTKSLLLETEFSNEKIAKMVGVNVDFFQEIRRTITTQKE